MNSILILRGGALGDFLVTIPALRLLRERWPGARIELVGNQSAAELALRDGLIAAAHSQHEARWAPLHGDVALARPLADWLGGFDLVVNWWPDPDGALASHFPVRRGQQFVAGEAKPTTAPAGRHFCTTLEQLGIPLRVPSATLGFAREMPMDAARGRRVAIHPGSSSPRRNWPLERWLEVCRRLRGAGREVFVVCGEVEEGIVRRFEGEAIVKAGLPLVDLALLLGRCESYAGHDTGVTHLAAAAGCRVTALFGPSDPAIWAPSEACVLKRGDDVAAISVDEVCEAILGESSSRDS
ncbi:lipopolysaccharide core biosynthesis protein [mine drainage metagenome]|uniref:Lipopolysaccharide core biosynthesis protein n=1 Tax=mine drainage metagenome TaxID=410659 RepID=A0A1J5TR16_9ZZZZ